MQFVSREGDLQSFRKRIIEIYILGGKHRRKGRRTTRAGVSAAHNHSMTVSSQIRHNAISGLRRIASSEPLLPFLYNTRTIRTQHTDALSDFEERPQRPARGRDVAYKRLNFNHRDRDGPSERPRYQNRHYARPEHVPFEDATQEKESVRENMNTSTMTPSEKKAFEGLLGMRSQKGTQSDRFNVPDNLREMFSPDELKDVERTIQQEDAHTIALNKAVETDMSRVNTAFEKAQTDVELWQVMHQEVLSRILALDLDGSSTEQGSPPKRKPKGAKIPKWQGGVTDETVITKNAPGHLVRFSVMLRDAFPASQLNVSLVPYLKSLGPATFAFLGTTALYNLHMRALMRQTCDISSVLSTLQEMDKQVYDLDHKSASMVAKFLKTSRAARRGELGPGREGLWDSERFVKCVNGAFYWSTRVENLMQERALRESREKEDTAFRYIAVPN